MLYIVRGLPGSGKSTYAKKLGCFHVESDMYFVCDKGDYQFDPRRLQAAHVWCAKTVRTALETGMDVVVSNTFTQYWELEPYIKMAKEMKMPYEIIEIRTFFGSVHNVPPEKIVAMEKRWENLNGKEFYTVIQ